LDKGLADGFCHFGRDGVGVNGGLDFGGEVEEPLFELGVGLDDISVKIFQSLALDSDEGWCLSDEQGEEAHGLSDEEHVIVGAEVAKIGNAAKEMLP
jgi:hypothetical protein